MGKQKDNIEIPSAEKHCCYNCHFLCSGEKDSSTTPGEVKEEKREKLINGKCENTFSCYHRIWSINLNNTERQKDVHDLIKEDRKDDCFFYPYIPRISFSAAETLERREANRREAEKDREVNRLEAEKNRTANSQEADENRTLTRKNAKTARNTAIAAILVAAISVAVTIYSLLSSKPQHIIVDDKVKIAQPVDANTQEVVKPTDENQSSE
jgi:hypothetical protein